MVREDDGQIKAAEPGAPLVPYQAVGISIGPLPTL